MILSIRTLLQELKSSGIRDIYTLSNDSIIDVIRLCEEYNFCMHPLFAEENISIAAGVHARHSGKVTAVLASEGFSINKMINGLVAARIQYLPLLCILIKTNEVAYPLSDQQQNMSISIEDYLAVKGIQYAAINYLEDLESISTLISKISCEKIPRLLTFRLPSFEGRGGHLGIDHVHDTFDSPIGDKSDITLSVKNTDQYILNQHHDFNNCVAIVGNGIHQGDNAKRIARLIEQLDILYCTLPSSKSYLSELHINYIGCYFGKYSSTALKNLFRSASHVLKICVEEYPFDFYQFDQFLDELDLAKRPKVLTLNSNNISNFAHAYFKEASSGHSPILASKKDIKTFSKDRVLLKRLSDALSVPHLSPKFIVSDVGFSCLFSLNIQLFESDQYVSNHVSASMAMSLASAIGIAASTSHVPIWIIIGDGSLLMSLNDLPSLVSLRTNINIILLDNQQYLTENLRYQSQLHHTPPVDWRMLMHSFGVEHYRKIQTGISQDIDMILSSAWMDPDISLIHIVLYNGLQANDRDILQLPEFLKSD